MATCVTCPVDSQQYLETDPPGSGRPKGAQSATRQASSRPASASADEGPGKKELRASRTRDSEAGRRKETSCTADVGQRDGPRPDRRAERQLQGAAAEKSAAEEAWLALAVDGDGI